MSDVRLDGQPAPPFVPGYRLERRLGAGGMGAVWVGVEERTGVRRAVKVLAAGADVELRLRFMREAEAMARVDDHPGVVRVHAAGGGASGAWLVMDLAAGGDLEGRLRRGPLAPDAALTLGRALAHALAHVHARGVLHRDLKPANVLFDEHGAPKLVDFGLARLQGTERLSLSGALLGTPVYMAPEQAQGLPADERADVYGLGAVLYHALTGRAPVRSGPLLAVLAQVIERAPTPPSATSPGTSPAFEAAVLRALAKAPEERFPTAAAFAAALDHAALHPGVRPRPRVPPALVVAAALAVVLAAAAIPGAARRTTPSTPPPTSAAGPETTAGRPASLATDALRRAVLDDDPRRGLDLLAEARDAANHDVLAWAAALAFLAEDAAAATRWAERPEARGRAGTWLRTVARVLSPAASGEGAVVEDERALNDLRDLFAARAAAREWTFSVLQGATRELLEEAVAPLSGLIDVARRAGASAPPPVRLALGVFAQRALCERRADLLNLVATAADHADRRPVALRALAAARDLAPASRPALGLWTLAAAASTTRLGRESGEAPAPEDPGLIAAVDALPTDGPYAWVRGLHGAVWLAGVQDPHPHETERRWAIVEAHLPKMSDARSATTPAGQRVQELASRARTTIASARVHEAWSVARRGEDDGPAREAALAMIREVPDPTRTWLAARVHLLAGEPARARALLEAVPDRGREHEFTASLLVECGLQEGRADAIQAGLAILSPRPRARLEEHGIHALWTALARALRGDPAGARAALESARGRDTQLGVSVPWRSPDETRRQVDAIAAGTWRPGPGVRPFPPR